MLPLLPFILLLPPFASRAEFSCRSFRCNAFSSSRTSRHQSASSPACGARGLLLAAVIALFSLVFPAVKLLLVRFAAYSPERTGIPGWFRALANWSMFDVILVALLIFAAKTSGVATAFTKPGLWFFAASVVLTATASALTSASPLKPERPKPGR